MESKPPKRSTGYRVRLSPAEKRQLERLADHAGVTVADALRIGARSYLLDVVLRQR